VGLNPELNCMGTKRRRGDSTSSSAITNNLKTLSEEV